MKRVGTAGLCAIFLLTGYSTEAGAQLSTPPLLHSTPSTPPLRNITPPTPPKSIITPAPPPRRPDPLSRPLPPTRYGPNAGQRRSFPDPQLPDTTFSPRRPERNPVKERLNEANRKQKSDCPVSPVRNPKTGEYEYRRKCD
ncbi:hypothetical protein GR183_07185 [Stappia sp. GBMRC 2046]|uniref:Uncharacterized protein n=1 Tax=Stappia sediminis TaxID=2692190 RepID=A0A7X3LT86_9HYPH|nr:hypothetical protein [Stappia sediminis]MXN64684.1 hypothetical protein [Stappia sediminis]